MPSTPLAAPCRERGEPPVCSQIKAVGPPSPKAAAHRPTVWGSLSSASAAAEAVQPWASNSMAYHRSRSRGVGDRIIRRRKSLESIRHCSRNRSISLTPITNPSLTQRCINPTPLQLSPLSLRISPWLWFSINASQSASKNAKPKPRWDVHLGRGQVVEHERLPGTGGRASARHVSQSSSSHKCTSHLGFSLVR